MIRGTTPTLTFTLPFEVDEIEELFITFSQGGEVVLDKSKDECICEGNTVTLKLSQQDTLALSDCCSTEIQMRIKSIEDEAVASEIITVPTLRILKDGEI